MKKLLTGILIMVIVSTLVGCDQKSAPNDKSKEEIEFIEPESSSWVNYTKPIREYMYYRTQAVINDDINILWKRYPELKNSIDRNLGINVEKYEVETLNKDFELIDANYNIEAYERIKVQTINENEIIVLVHGAVTYLRNDFDESGGEHLIKIFLKRIENQWTVVKTDEYTQEEYKEWLKDN
ncbi:LptM family lipoprotein [Lysinibacillus sp. 54212]|uniref:LptM family lipoprotein n=1 Tax=Lysinibacillus sp. 54212 TaxID=3119829 RepID=UPI002FCAAB81